MIGIYKITNNVTKKSYIGQSGRLESRLSSHKNIAFNKNSKQYNEELYKDIRKYGINNFSFKILETISLNELEEKWIQKEIETNEVYNKNLTPHTNNLSVIRCLNDEQVLNIIELLKENKISNIKIAKMFNCSSSTIDNINNGISYKIESEKYPIRKYENIGEQNHNSKYTDEEVLNIRKEFEHHTLKELFDKYSKNKNIKSFERMVTGRSYSHLPIYKKRENKWYD